jgi:DNA-binding response OmpR family regulator
MAERIAIVEDERLVRELVAVNLRHAGYEIVAAENFEQGKQLLAQQQFHLAILDVMLPGGDGFALTRFARDQGINAPILMLTARSDTTSKVRGLDAGADDYLPKPFDVNELLARVRALLRRRRAAVPVSQFGDCEIDLVARRVRRQGRDLALTAKEYALLAFFAGHPGRALPRDLILDAVWGTSVFVTPRSIDRCVTTLRAKVEPNPREPIYIQTVRDIGYRFEPGGEA